MPTPCDKLFVLCAYFLQWLAKTFKLTYEEISVIFNQWIQGAILTISGCFPLMTILLANGSCDKMVLFGAIAYAAIYIAAFAYMLWHYRLPFQRAFDVCVYDLLLLGGNLRLTYNVINILIFVVLFLIVVVANTLCAILICQN